MYVYSDSERHAVDFTLYKIIIIIIISPTFLALLILSSCQAL